MLRLLLFFLLSLSAKLIFANASDVAKTEVIASVITTETAGFERELSETWPWPHKERRRINRKSKRALRKSSKGSRRHAKGVSKARKRKKDAGSRTGVKRRQIIKKKEGCNT